MKFVYILSLESQNKRHQISEAEVSLAFEKRLLFLRKELKGNAEEHKYTITRSNIFQIIQTDVAKLHIVKTANYYYKILTQH